MFLASDSDALRIVGPAGRHAVSVDVHFANIYVDPATRASARDEMLAALAAGDAAAFSRLARAYQVTHVLVRGDIAAAMTARNPGVVRPMFSANDVSILSVAR